MRIPDTEARELLSATFEIGAKKLDEGVALPFESMGESNVAGYWFQTMLIHPEGQRHGAAFVFVGIDIAAVSEIYEALEKVARSYSELP